MAYQPQWIGAAPKFCEICTNPIVDEFVDGATTRGWGRICLKCHKIFGRGLGVGKGQRYTKQANGRFIKTGG